MEILEYVNKEIIIILLFYSYFCSKMAENSNFKPFDHLLIQKFGNRICYFAEFLEQTDKNVNSP